MINYFLEGAFDGILIWSSIFEAMLRNPARGDLIIVEPLNKGHVGDNIIYVFLEVLNVLNYRACTV